MKKLIAAVVIVLFFVSCSLQSYTTIKPLESFVLGNNEHGRFKVKMRNLSNNDLQVYHAPINGGRHSSQNVKPNERVTVKVEKNTSLVIDNKSKDTASVDLNVTGDIGLSMGYKYEQ